MISFNLSTLNYSNRKSLANINEQKIKNKKISYYDKISFKSKAEPIDMTTAMRGVYDLCLNGDAAITVDGSSGNRVGIFFYERLKDAKSIERKRMRDLQEYLYKHFELGNLSMKLSSGGNKVRISTLDNSSTFDVTSYDGRARLIEETLLPAEKLSKRISEGQIIEYDTQISPKRPKRRRKMYLALRDTYDLLLCGKASLHLDSRSQNGMVISILDKKWRALQEFLAQQIGEKKLLESHFGRGNLIRIHTPDSSVALEVTRSNGRVRFMEDNSLPLENLSDLVPPEDLEQTLLENRTS